MPMVISTVPWEEKFHLSVDHERPLLLKVVADAANGGVVKAACSQVKGSEEIAGGQPGPKTRQGSYRPETKTELKAVSRESAQCLRGFGTRAWGPSSPHPR